MTTTAWFHCFAGISGDMALGACFDAGADVPEVLGLIRRLPVGGWELTTEPVLRGGLAATRAVVHAPERGVVRTYGHIAGLLTEARLPDRVRDRAGRVFRRLAEAEGRLHRRSPEQVHFHEVGSLDAIVDVVGTCAALEVLGIDRITASEVATGRGMIRSAHGMLPNPSPAVVELLQGAPMRGLDLDVELTTPTGAALLAALADRFGPLPALRVERSGFGAGSRELDALPNVVQLVVGVETAVEEPEGGEPLLVLETNVDDLGGEVVAHATQALLDAGALDVWTRTITMKKGRPAVEIAVLCRPPDAARLRDLLADETGTLGVRGTEVVRWPFARELAEVEVEGFPVRVKRSARRTKVEYEDAARVARRTGLPVREVISRAEAAARALDDRERSAGPIGPAVRAVDDDRDSDGSARSSDAGGDGTTGEHEAVAPTPLRPPAPPDLPAG